VYSPLHGSGAVPVSRALAELGIEVSFVEEQRDPDENFPTVTMPNPEEADALKMALSLAARKKADLVLATDPDADRLGTAVAHEGSFALLTGNQLGVLLADYIFGGRAEQGTLPQKPAFVKTIVTTELQRRVAEKWGARCFDTLTGFKYIAEKIARFESEDDGLEYVFGGEESYGYLAGTAVRDKDAVSAAVLTAEMALYHRTRGQSLLGRLDQIYEEHGYYEEMLISRYFKGEKGADVMKGLMRRLRDSPPAELGGEQVAKIKDYADGTVRDPTSGTVENSIDLPSSNVLQFILSDDSIVTARPSGTEPKIKFYASCCGAPGDDLAASKRTVSRKLAGIRDAINSLIGEQAS
ncbi:MAG: phospho-sugar mutase, partial [Chitinivibrionales bacterium]|nr:phospho-sugar mutase [Chitinivibrionales bacterium]MBD3395857.1 phospho-sugar mutase [Chitinivibrionales bacterium]